MAGLPVDLVAFDLTGTMVKDNGAMVSALKGAMSQHGIPYTEADVVAMRGAGKRGAFRALAEQGLEGSLSQEILWSMADEAYATFRRLLRDEYARGPLEEIPGALATMRWLRERGVKVGATTALGMELRDLVLGRLGWAGGLFDCKVSTDEVPRGRPAPYMIFMAMMQAGVTDVHRVAVVGDTPVDLQAGTNAGVGWVIGVLSGVHGLETLGAVAHTHILNSVAGLPRVFELPR